MKFEYWQSTTNHQWYWHLKGANGEKLAQGEGYVRKEDCLHVIALVQSSKTAAVVHK